MTTDQTLRDALQAIRQDGVSTVSVSLFGTLLLRTCLNVESVFERSLAHAPVPARLKDIAESYVQHRNLAGNRQVFNRGNDPGNTPYDIDRIFSEFAFPPFGLSRGLTPDLIEAELRATEELSVVNPAIRALLDEARALGRRVGVAADGYWSTAQVERLLRRLAPDLALDFVLASCDGAVRAAGGLAAALRAAAGQGQWLHVGAEEEDFEPVWAGCRRLPYAPPPDPWARMYEREETAARLFGAAHRGFAWRQDGGLRLLRRLALADLAAAEPERQVAAAVLGPAMLAFHEQVRRRAAELAGPERRLKVIFLARDGYLAHRVWTALDGGDCAYLELNRRIAIIAGSEGEEGYATLTGLFSNMDWVNADSIEQFFKITLSDEMRAVFREAGGQISGPAFAEQLPDMVGGMDRLRAMAEEIRDSLLDYLVAQLGPLDQYTDWLLADVGYTGNIQRALRRMFDRMGLRIRLHGHYLMPHGEAFIELPEGDSVSGFLDELTTTPAIKRAIMRDGPLIEEFCCAPVGSTRGYADGRELREKDVRLPQEVAFCLGMQEDCVAFITRFQRLARGFGVDPLADLDHFRMWSAAILARFVMMPSALECQTFGPLLHDVGLGTEALIATITTQDVANLMGVLPFPAVASISHPPVWLGGSMMAYGAGNGFAYAMTGFGIAVNDVLADVAVGSVTAVLLRGQEAVPVPSPLLLTPSGDLRIRIPLFGKDTGNSVAVPLTGQIRRGVLRSIILQCGEDMNTAAVTRDGIRISRSFAQPIKAVMDGSYYRASEDDAFLVIPVPKMRFGMTLLNIMLTPVFD
ncbi:hypothetical protein GALL_299000 [mine drainage metagenome]|uniref:Uncharacterized protein n=1 Tax=mine drainage metagenome TaxID=410659 RepID=A0A1J5QXA6_9ZZZZ